MLAHPVGHPPRQARLQFVAAAMAYQLHLPVGWISEPKFDVLAVAKQPKPYGDSIFHNYLRVYESNLERERKGHQFSPDANAEFSTRTFRSDLGSFVVLETVVLPRKASNGNTYSDHIITYALEQASGKHLVLRFAFPFPERLREVGGSIESDLMTHDEARNLVSQNRTNAERIVVSLRRVSAIPPVAVKRQNAPKVVEQKLGGVRCQIVVPPGKSLKTVATVVLTIPPSGSAKVLAPVDCARRGWASVALTGLRTSDPIKLRDIGAKVIHAIDEVRGNASARFVFAGFSAGGFAAAALTKQFENRCSGLIAIGSFTAAQYLPANKQLPIVLVIGTKDFNRPQALQAQSRAHADDRNLQMISFEGGHSWGSAREHERALSIVAGDKL